MRYFDYAAGLRMTNARFDALFGGTARKPTNPWTSARWTWLRPSSR